MNIVSAAHYKMYNMRSQTNILLLDTWNIWEVASLILNFMCQLD